MELYYIMDPQCGWCYATSSNIVALVNAFAESDIVWNLMVGGMMIDEGACVGNASFRKRIEMLSAHMQQATGTKLSESFFKLMGDSTYTISSMQASAAIVLVKEIAREKTFLFAREVQRAQFLNGKRYDQRETYDPIIEQLGIDRSVFQTRLWSEENMTCTRKEFQNARTMASGFPTLIQKTRDGFDTIISGYFELDPIKSKIKNLHDSLFLGTSIKM